MKLIDVINRVDRTETHWVDYQEIGNDLGLEIWNAPKDFQDRVKSYHLIKWLCTDTWVGANVIYFDGRPLALTKQIARKEDTRYYYVSKEIVAAFQRYILDSKIDGDDHTSPTLIDPNEEVNEFYTVSYGSQLLTKDGFYQGRPVKVAETFERDISLWKVIDIKEENGEIHRIPVKEFKIPLGLGAADQELPPPDAPVIPTQKFILFDEGGKRKRLFSFKTETDLLAIFIKIMKERIECHWYHDGHPDIENPNFVDIKTFMEFRSKYSNDLEKFDILEEETI